MMTCKFESLLCSVHLIFVFEFVGPLSVLTGGCEMWICLEL